MRHCRFLETEFGFVCKTSKPPFVIYESERLRVSVYYDADGRHELDLGIRRLGADPRRSLSIGVGMLIRLKDGQSSQGYTSPFPSTADALENEVARLAFLLRRYGSGVLRGDLHDLDRIEQLEQEFAVKYGHPEQED